MEKKLMAQAFMVIIQNLPKEKQEEIYAEWKQRKAKEIEHGKQTPRIQS